jgi:protein-L-isoaspartate(D-aspartate) O-methyltransferase
MVDTQLRSRRIHDARVLEAMSTVPREEFVPAEASHCAYGDTPLPIGCGQTISQPYTVAFMCQALQLEGNEKVLEIGTGSGYGAAVLSKLADQVCTIERISSLAGLARERLERLAYSNVHVRVANGTLGLPEEAPFDGIVVTAAAAGVPWRYLEQLAEGGRLVIPLGESFMGQTLYRFTRNEGRLLVADLGGFAFVPLVGEYGQSDPEFLMDAPEIDL